MKDDELLAALLQKFSKGLNLIKKELAPDGVDFIIYSTEMKNSAHFERCRISNIETKIFFHCKDCSYAPTSVYCINCFDKEQHIGHQYHVVYSNSAVCDCGDPTAIKRECWCDKHHHCTKIEKLPPERVSVLKNCINALLKYAVVKVKSDKIFSRIFDFLKEITEWGSIYIDIISEVLFANSYQESPFGKIIESYKDITPKNIETFSDFCLEIVTSPIFKKYLLTYAIDIYQNIALFFETNSNMLAETLQILSLFFQCHPDFEHLIYLEQTRNFHETLLNILFHSFSQLIITEANGDKHYDEEKIKFFYQLKEPPMSLIYYNQLFMNYLVKYCGQNLAKSLASNLSIADSIISIRRKTGEKEPFDTNYPQQSLILFLNLYDIIQQVSIAFSTINAEDIEEFSQKKLWDYKQKPLTNEDMQKAISFLQEIANVLDPIIDRPQEFPSAFGADVKIVDPITMEFSFSHPVTELFLHCLMYFCIHTSTPSKQIMKSIHLESMDSLIAQPCTTYGAIIEICSKLFTKNNNSIFSIAYYLQSFPAIVGNCQIILDFIDDPGKFVTVFAESCGLTHWINSENEYQDEFTNCIVLMLRAFIIFSTFDLFSCYHPKDETIRQGIIHLLWSGSNTKEQILTEAYKFYFQGRIPLFIKPLVDIKEENEQVKLFLKPEIEKEETNFFSFFLNFTSFKNLYLKVNKHLSKIEIIPNCPLPNLFDYLKTPEMKHLLIIILQTTQSNNNKKTSLLFYCILHLIILMLKAGVEASSLFDVLELFNENVKEVDGFNDLLKEFSQLYPEFTPIFKFTEIEETIQDEIKIDIERAKKQFLTDMKISDELRKEMEELSEEEKDNNEDNSSLIQCPFCKGTILRSQPSGLLVTLFQTNILDRLERVISQDDFPHFPSFCQVRTCTHFCHQVCFPHDDDQYIDLVLALFQPFQRFNRMKRCPLDRAPITALIPIFYNTPPPQESIDKLEEIVLQNCSDVSFKQSALQNICLYEILLRTNEKYINKTSIRLALYHFLRAAFYSKSNEILYDDIFLTFGFDILCFCNILSPLFDQEFAKRLTEFWPNAVTACKYVQLEECLNTFIRRVQLLYGCLISPDKEIKLLDIPHFIEKYKLQSIDSISTDYTLAALPTPCREYMFPDLPETFTDFFLDPTKTEALSRDDVDIVLCLLCGTLCTQPKQDGVQINQSNKIPSLTHHIKSCNQCGSTPFLYLTGQNISLVECIDYIFPDISLRCPCGSIYLDDFGDTDKGLQSGSDLHLNKDKAKKLFEDICTGEIRRKSETKDLPFPF